jgi:hypothetical protein
MKILTGNSNRPLAEAICAALNLPLTQASVRRFSDMEVFVEINENVRGEDVFVIQSTSYPANDNLMELLVAMDALRRGSARRITAVIPYYGYARQDRKSGPRTPISAQLVATLLTVAGADRLLTLDLPAGQLPGLIDIVGVLRWPDARSWFTPNDDPAKNLWFVRDPVAIAAEKSWGPVPPFYVEQEAPAPPGGLPAPGKLKPNLPNNHLQYAITWFGLAAVLAGVFAVFARGRYREGRA